MVDISNRLIVFPLVPSPGAITYMDIAVTRDSDCITVTSSPQKKQTNSWNNVMHSMQEDPLPLWI